MLTRPGVLACRHVLTWHDVVTGRSVAPGSDAVARPDGA
jgi:hypothetical protein